MNVLILFSSPGIGGAEQSLLRMVASSSENVHYQIANFGGDGPLRRRSYELKLNYFRLHLSDSRFSQWLPRVFEDLFSVRNCLKSSDLDIAYVIGFKASVFVRIMGIFNSKLKVVHGIRWNPNTFSALDLGLRLFESVFTWSISGYICNSRAAACTLKTKARVSSNKLWVIYNGLDSIDYASEPLVQTGENVVVIVATLAPRKGQLPFISNVVRTFDKLELRCKFIFVGRDDMQGRAQELVDAYSLSHLVEFTGFVSDPREFVLASSLVVVPSLANEGCPTVILEAMALQRVVVAFDIDGISELVEHNVTGLLVPNRDYAALAEAMLTLLMSPELRLEMGVRARKRVMAEFSIDDCANKHFDVFSRLVGTDN